MEEQSPYIEFDMIAIRELKIDYENTKECILELLPDVNWNSIVETKEFFKDTLYIDLPNTKLSTFKILLEDYESGDITEDDRDFLQGIVQYKVISALLRNYIDCILRHEVEGKVYLRHYNGEWVLPNRQPLPYCEAITECIIKLVVPEKG